MDKKEFKNPLWLKEESKSDLYVDIFSTEFHGFSMDVIQSEVDRLVNNRPNKDNGKSKTIRIDGNKLFSEGKYYRAMEKYNLSACYAEKDSHELALAYSNRSNCYLKLKLFKLCMNDIEMIKRSNYPSLIENKLKTRQAECEQFISMHNVESVRIDTQKVELSFGEHARYAGVAECLELHQNNKWGRHVKANRHLEINETVMVESPFSFVGHECNDLKYYRCSHCYKSLMNFIPCKECVGSMFCDSECLEAANKSRHQFECQLAKIETNCDCNENEFQCKEKEFQMVFDLLWKIVSGFETVNELIETIESILHGNGATRTDATLKGLEMILQLETNKEKQNVERMIQNSLRVYSVAMTMEQFYGKFVFEKQKRFFKHLILHLLHNARQAVLFSDLDVDVTLFHLAEPRIFGTGLYSFGSLLNHSCVPNVFCYAVDNRLICKVIRPINKGEQLLRSYVSGQTLIMEKEDDADIQAALHFLKTEYDIDICKCFYCSLRALVPDVVPDPWLETKNPNYLEIRTLLTSEIGHFYRMSCIERKAYVHAAIAYLYKYEPTHPIREMILIYMYLQSYWMLTTAQCD